jgi:hypothetical protein
MSPQLSSELIQFLRVTLQTIDEEFPSKADEPVVAELKGLLLLRIGELEAGIIDNRTEPMSLKASE